MMTRSQESEVRRQKVTGYREQGTDEESPTL
jgi:hypothetical protein